MKAVIDPFDLLNVSRNSNPFGIRHFDPGITISFKHECDIIMQIRYKKNLKARRFGLGATLS